MIFTAMSSVFWMEKIVSIAAILQSVELIQIRRTYSPGGVWTWETLQKEFEIFPKFFQRVFDLLLKYPNFYYLLLIRLFSAGALFLLPHPVFLSILFLSTLLIAIRWRGTFNGGSDSMTLIILAALSIARIFENEPRVIQGCLWYVTLQTCLSYFLGGLVKLRQKPWRTGKALHDFIHYSTYNTPQLLKNLSERTLFFWLASWSVIAFECAFPIALLNSQVCSLWIGLATLFHGMNVFIFGLNRFFFAWIASYPALYYCSHQLSF
jgi:hypothetical protein